jgi:hypothetical protein
MHTLKCLFALLVVTTLAASAQGTEKDFNGRWDIEVHAKPADIRFTTTKAWRLGITGARTPERPARVNRITARSRFRGIPKPHPHSPHAAQGQIN